eukprot:1192208-Prorocentrum_minimum.AAC.9
MHTLTHFVELCKSGSLPDYNVILRVGAIETLNIGAEGCLTTVSCSMLEPRNPIPAVCPMRICHTKSVLPPELRRASVLHYTSAVHMKTVFSIMISKRKCTLLTLSRFEPYVYNFLLMPPSPPPKDSALFSSPSFVLQKKVRANAIICNTTITRWLTRYSLSQMVDENKDGGHVNG